MRRREYLDWLRGLAVLLMIAAHMLDSWTGEPDRLTRTYRALIFVSGLGSPLFLLLAGVSVGLSAGSKSRRTGSAARASNAVARRGLEIFALAFLFRLQSWVLGWSSNPYDLLKVDILNIMGPSIVVAAVLWRTARTFRGRLVTFAFATALIAFLTPPLRLISFGGLPDPIEAYVVPVRGLSNFVFFPWMAFLLAGACLGVLIDQAVAPERERSLNLWFAGVGAALTGAAIAASFLPSPYVNSYFWTTSPAYFVLRVGLVTVGIAAAYAWTSRYAGAGQWRPVLQLGRTSLFVYWIHVEMVYGLISRPLHRSLSLPQAAVAYVFFTAFILLCSVAKDRFLEWYRVQRAAAVTV